MTVEYTEYPKMMYHPQGAQEVTGSGITVNVPSVQMVTGPNGAQIPIMGPALPQVVGEHKSTIYMIVGNSREEQALRDQGWHDHPGAAEAARLGTEWTPPKVSPSAVKSLSAENEELKSQLKELEEKMSAVKAQREAANKSEEAQQQLEVATTKSRK